MTEPVLEIDGLEITFGAKRRLGRASAPIRAVNDVSFEVLPGETFGLVGESGSGKTTIGRAAMGLLEPSAGTMRFGGEPVTSGRWPAKRRQQLQAVFQDPLASLNPTMTVGAAVREVLVLVGVNRSDATQRTEELFHSVALPPTAMDRYPAELSGGQRQRVNIARALATSPRLVVCDEPTSALDVSTQAQVLNLLRDLQADVGVAYLFITHDLAVVEQMSDRVGVLYRGELVEVGPASRVAQAPGHPYTRLLLASAPHPDPRTGPARRAGRKGLDTGIAPRSEDACPFASRCPFVFDRCLSERPEPTAMIDGGEARCHLHTDGPQLGGASVIDLPLPERRAAAS